MATKKVRSTKKQAAKKTTRKKRTLNKSEAIREYKAANPDMGPTEMAGRLTAKHKTRITPSQVSQALSIAKRNNGTTRGRKGKGVTVPVTSIDLAGKLLKDCGGKESAIALIKAIAD